MSENVEIKARAPDLGRLKELAAALSGAPPQVLHQEDTFFNVRRGRLKLRVASPDEGQLIYYERADRRGPRPSRYRIANTSDPASLRDALAAALGVRGTVRKVRTLYMVGQTRVHLDRVEGLGDFVELEVVLRPGQAVEDARRVAEELMAKLGIRQDDLVAGSYVDLLADGAKACREASERDGMPGVH